MDRLGSRKGVVAPIIVAFFQTAARVAVVGGGGGKPRFRAFGGSNQAWPGDASVAGPAIRLDPNARTGMNLPREQRQYEDQNAREPQQS